jgi:hypothetical protein
MPLYKITIIRLVMAENESQAKDLADQQENPYNAEAEIVTSADQVPEGWLNCHAYSEDGSGSEETIAQMLGVFHGRTADDAHLEADYEDRVSGMED